MTGFRFDGHTMEDQIANERIRLLGRSPLYRQRNLLR